MIPHQPHQKQKIEVVGLMPAGGLARRLYPLPCSKEIFPVGFRMAGQGQILYPKPVCHHLLEGMCSAGISKAYVVLRQGKWDIPAYLGSGVAIEMHLAYLMVDLPFGVPYTIDQAYPFIQGSTVALGFPDIIFEPKDVFVHLLARLRVTGADVVLGLLPSPNPKKMDLVETTADGRVRDIQIKPQSTHLRYTWILAVWNPSFSHFMHAYVQGSRSVEPGEGLLDDPCRAELHMSEVILDAIRKGLRVDSVTFPAGSCLDIGTPDDLFRACRTAIVSVQSEPDGLPA